MRKTMFVAVAVLGLAGAARANPYMTEGAMAVEVPGTTHVQVSFFCQSGVGTCSAPAGVTRDGQALTETWTQGSISHNGGSGVAGYTAFQFCDCSLAVGTYKYSITTAPGAMEKSWDVSATVTEPVVLADVAAEVGVAYSDSAAIPAQPDAAIDIVDDEVFPWDQPEPAWPQGLDCVAWCNGHVPPVETVADTATVAETVPASDIAKTDVATQAEATADAAAADAATAAQSETGGGSTCAAGMAPGDPGIVLLLAGLALGLARRRRA